MAMSVEPLAGERHSNETEKAVLACNDYLRMGPGRSLEKLYQTYTKDTLESAPTRHLRTLKEWSTTYGWVGRANAFDAVVDAAKTVEVARLRTEGLAADYERIRKLTRLAELLEKQIYEQNDDGNLTRLWLPDVKQIGGGEFAERVDIERFNSALIEQFRGTLDDIAKEVGGRKTEVTHGGSVGLEVSIKQKIEKVYGDHGS